MTIFTPIDNQAQERRGRSEYDKLLRVMEQAMDGVIECECCGESIEPDGTCPEGTPSPLLAAGMI